MKHVKPRKTKGKTSVNGHVLSVARTYQHGRATVGADVLLKGEPFRPPIDSLTDEGR